MPDELNSGPSANFWIIGGAALVWNLLGLFIYYQEVTMSPDALANLTEAQQAFLSNRPGWATSAYAIAVTTGVLASVLFLLRKRLAVIMFAVSLAAILVQDIYGFVIGNGIEVWGTPALVIAVVVLAVAVALVLYARAAQARNWLG